MLKILVIAVFVNSILGCRWVCVNEKHKIVKEYIDNEQFKVEYQTNEITIPQTEVKKPTRGKRLNNKTKLPEPKLQVRMPEFAVEPQEVCKSKEFKDSIKEIRQKVKCKPRDTIVDINYKGGKVFPEKVSTKLCSGGCTGTKTCLSVEQKNHSIAVSVLSPNSNKFQCTRVMIPQDTKCRCSCDKSATCLSSQVLDKKLCKCKCINEDEHADCLNQMMNGKPKIWNKDNCLCQCKYEHICTTGTEWNKTECKCIKKGKRS